MIRKFSLQTLPTTLIGFASLFSSLLLSVNFFKKIVQVQTCFSENIYLAMMMRTQVEMIRLYPPNLPKLKLAAMHEN